MSRKTPEEDDWSKGNNSKLDYEDNRDRDASKQGRLSHHAEIEENTRGSLGGAMEHTCQRQNWRSAS